ncbi:hypothetical protein HanPI659440_Chr13g0511811 [Helianthus annuus]|nr:hypothetical protein HanPI659440_Chr13g0511811 [Helianthus annuus]
MFFIFIQNKFFIPYIHFLYFLLFSSKHLICFTFSIKNLDENGKKSQISWTIWQKRSNVWMKMPKILKSEELYSTRKLFWMKMTNIPKPQGRFWQFTLFLIHYEVKLIFTLKNFLLRDFKLLCG